MIRSILSTAFVLLLAHQVGRAQVVVNPDGSHSIVTGSVIVNPDGSHSVKSGNIIVNPNGTHSVIAGNVIVNPDGSHSILSGIKKPADTTERKPALRYSNREPGDLEKWISRLFGKAKRKKAQPEAKQFIPD